MRATDQTIMFKPSLLGWLITLICIPLFINFGLWQYNKAEKQKQRQTAYQQSGEQAAEPFPLGLSYDAPALRQQWNYHRVTVKGNYVPQYQFLLDNQVHQTRAGYHVITPLKIDGTEEYVLVNRGWVPAMAVHTDLPQVQTPTTLQAITGQAWVPSKKYFTLADKTTTGFKPAWQFMDLALYQQTVPIKVSPIVIKLAPESEAAGFVRDWQVSFKRIATHMSYAYQWFGFAFATLMIFIYMSVKHPETAD